MQNSFAISPYPHCRRLLPSRKNQEEFGMKKLIVFSVVLALLGTLAFADVTVSGNFRVNLDLIKQSAGDPDATMGQSTGAGQVDVSFGDEIGGGKVRLFAFPMKGWFQTPHLFWESWEDPEEDMPGVALGNANPFAFAWWKPMDMLRIQFGLNPDGDFGAAQISYWGYNAEAQDMVATDNGEANVKFQRVGFYDGFGDMGILFSITPMDELAVNIALPFSGGQKASAHGIDPQNVFLKAHLNIKYIMGIGIINFSFEGSGQKGGGTSPGTIWASFYLTSLDNMAIDIGIGFGLPHDSIKGRGLEIGVGFKMDMGDLGLKARLGASLMKEDWDDSLNDWSGGMDESIRIGFGVLPYYDLGSFIFFFNAGVDILMPKVDGNSGDMALDWYVNPYIKKTVGSINVYAGIKIFSEKIDGGDGKVSWAVPIGFNCYF
jgi:hypothetical protein